MRLQDKGSLAELACLMREVGPHVALTGAGISTASDVPDFRSPGGLYEGRDPLQLASRTAWREEPTVFWEYYRARAEMLKRARPNPAHHALAALQREGYLGLIASQNVDGLHCQAGSRPLVELHGSISRIACLSCSALKDWDDFPRFQFNREGMPLCPACGGLLSPQVVLFGDELPREALSRTREAIERCELLLCIGSSLQVSPVADLPALALSRGARLAVLTASATPYDQHAQVCLHRPVEELLPELCRLLEVRGQRPPSCETSALRREPAQTERV